VERNNIVVDGAGYTVQGSDVFNSRGISLSGRNNVTIRKMTIKAFDTCISIDSSSDCSISGNNLTAGTFYGIHLISSFNNSISKNHITDGLNGIFLSSSDINGIYKNNITRSSRGVELTSSSENSIFENNIANNQEGILISNLIPYSSNNSILHNNFVDNDAQVGSFRSKDLWDNGCEGNYWSDYNGSDLDGDGVGDTSLPWLGVDNYPLMNPYWNAGDVNHDLKIDILDVVTIVAAYGTTPSNAHYNPHADIAAPHGKIDILDVVLCTRHYGEKYH
jgi:parallel beta-helix repeat protein